MRFQCAIIGTVMTFSSMGYTQIIEQDPRVEDAKLACVTADVTKGIRLLAELYTATSDPIWIFNQARCYQQNAQSDLALSRFKEYLRKSEGAPQEDIRDAQKHIAEIEKELSLLDSNNNKKIALSPPSQAPRQENLIQTPLNASSGRGLRYAGLGLGLVGVAALTSGAILSYLVREAEKEVEQQAKDGVTPTDPDYHRYQNNLSRGTRLESMQWVFYGVGAAAILGGGVLYGSGRMQHERSVQPVTASVSPYLTAQSRGAVIHLSY